MSDNDFQCVECFDTSTIDHMGKEITCPFCPEITTVKLTGLAHGLGDCYDSDIYHTLVAHTSSTMTFVGRREAIIADVMRVRQTAKRLAASRGLKGRNFVSSGPIAIEKRVKEALSRQG